MSPTLDQPYRRFIAVGRKVLRLSAPALLAVTVLTVVASVPAGAYYVLADVDRLPGETAAQKARHLLATTGVAAVAGSAFFRPGRGENLLRFCFAKKDADLDDACARLRKL